jgi:hypothetical protein
VKPPRWLWHTAAFAAVALVLTGCSAVATYGIAGTGSNPVVVEDGNRVAYFGYPFRFAKADVESSGYYYRVGDDVVWNPWEIPMTDYGDGYRRSWAAVFGALAMPLLLVILFIQCVRQLRLEHRSTDPGEPISG